MKTLINKFLRLTVYGLGALLTLPVFAENKEKTDRQSYTIFVDKNGVMRRSDTKEEVSYYGTNYTLPFAHAYRAVGNLGLDRKEAIDKDVYHMARLGFNGFRLHLWDVELADSAGNLLQNEHLDLLDYLISRLEDENIDIILTAQTNFGNGYPEKNIDTGSFSYDYGKCEIHSDQSAQEIQANYLTQLASHVNPYTGRTYGGDNAIIAMEINNEPCHTDSKKDVTAYINKMVKALKKGGFNKPILYNVSHNPEVTEAYYEADIQGTTYQWYPTGLVAGHQRKGNFLPYVNDYPIPWKGKMKNYDKLARVVYEFDPGDVLYSHLYPAIAKAFRKEGFQWITQFAYDPMDIARFNTEYQTHFLNLAYTPSKAISMMIAGEAARNIPRGKDFGSFPSDTIFDDFTVSYVYDLSLYNSPEKYYYSNNTSVFPKDRSSLKNIAGVGSSPVISYEGTGAYFLDKIEPDLWRLEVMPDVVITSDPFEKPSMKKEIAKIFYNERPIKIDLPQLGEDYFYQAVNYGNTLSGKSVRGEISVYPGVYLLSSTQSLISDMASSEDFKKYKLNRFAAPSPSSGNSIVINNPIRYINEKDDLIIEAEIIGEGIPEEVLVFPDYVSFWKDDNNVFTMENVEGNFYRAIIPSQQLGKGDNFRYNIVVKEKDKSYIWPQNIEGTPLDWDFTDYRYYTSHKMNRKDPIVLLKPDIQDLNLDVAMIPEAWNFSFTPSITEPFGNNSYNLFSMPENDGKIVVRRYVGDELNKVPFLDEKESLVVKIWPSIAMNGVSVGLTTKNGATYSATLEPKYLKEVETKLHSDYPDAPEYHIPLSDLKQTPTHVIPAVYPSFLPREIEIENIPFDKDGIDFIELVFPVKSGEFLETLIQGVWLQ